MFFGSVFGYERRFLRCTKQQESGVINCSIFTTLYKLRSLIVWGLAQAHRTFFFFFLHIKRWTSTKRIIIKIANLIKMSITATQKTKYTLWFGFKPALKKILHILPNL